VSVTGRLARLAPIALAGAALVAWSGCSPDLPPLKVPGPTTAHPDGADAGAALTDSATRVVARRSADSRIVSFRIAFAAGSADDPPGKEGLTELTAAVMSEGGTKSLTYAQLLEKLFPMASSIDVDVDRDQTVFVAEVSRASLDQFYPILREVLLEPRLDAEDFARLRTRATSTLTSDLRGADDEALGKEALQALVYENHPYGHPTVGTEHGIASITLEDLAAHRKRVFCKERVTVGVAGGFPEGFDAAMVKDLAQLPTCDGPRAALPAPRVRKGIHVLIVDKPTADATAISIGFPVAVTRASADYPALLFATDYLGLHRQSAGLLFRELREKRGLNYGDYAYAEFFAQAGGERYPRTNIGRRQQLASIWLRPMKPKNAQFALRGALRTYAKLLESGVPAADIARFRKFLSGYVGLEQQTESRRLGYAMDDAFYGLTTPYIETVRRGWDALDEAKVRAILATLPKTDLQIAIVTRDGAGLAAALEKGEASPVTYDAPKPDDVKSEDRAIETFPVPIRHEDVRVVPVADVFK
jgi:zinc protease